MIDYQTAISHGPLAKPGTVQSVDTSKRSCEVLLPGVDDSLTAWLGGAPELATTATYDVPAVGSTVWIAWLQGLAGPAVVLLTTAVSGIHLGTEGEGSNGGLIKIEELINALNNIKLVFDAHTHTETGVATDPPLNKIGIPTRSSLENLNVTH